MGLGSKVILPNANADCRHLYQWRPVDGQLIGDAETLTPALRHKTYTTVVARLQSPATFDSFRRALTSNQRWRWM